LQRVVGFGLGTEHAVGDTAQPGAVFFEGSKQRVLAHHRDDTRNAENVTAMVTFSACEGSAG
jgi:hypothetical protein